MIDNIDGIQAWFRNHCDGVWEHARRISIISCDNPGWWVKIDVRGTEVEAKHFDKISIGDFSRNIPQEPWIECVVENGVFSGAGDTTQLSHILQCFLSWVQPDEAE